MLLGHPGINVNLQDVESKWTPLHRALYSGNIAAWYTIASKYFHDFADSFHH